MPLPPVSDLDIDREPPWPAAGRLSSWQDERRLDDGGCAGGLAMVWDVTVFVALLSAWHSADGDGEPSETGGVAGRLALTATRQGMQPDDRFRAAIRWGAISAPLFLRRFFLGGFARPGSLFGPKLPVTRMQPPCSGGGLSCIN